MADQFDPQERALIERLQNAPQSELSPASFDAIRARLLDAVDKPPLPAPRPPVRFTPVVVVAAVVGLMLVVTVVLAALGVFTPAPASTPTVAPTDQPALTATSAPTQTPLAFASPTLQSTLLPVVSATSPPIAQATLATVIVIEGPVTGIDDTGIIIFNLHIRIDPANPLLPGLEIGDLIHVEGSTDEAGNIIAVIITRVENQVNINQQSGETWRDDGNCDHPPPDWAPAHGWRRRCQIQSGNGNNNGNGNGRGNGNGDDDEDD